MKNMNFLRLKFMMRRSIFICEEDTKKDNHYEKSRNKAAGGIPS